MEKDYSHIEDEELRELFEMEEEDDDDLEALAEVEDHQIKKSSTWKTVGLIAGLVGVAIIGGLIGYGSGHNDGYEEGYEDGYDDACGNGLDFSDIAFYDD